MKLIDEGGSLKLRLPNPACTRVACWCEPNGPCPSAITTEANRLHHWQPDIAVCRVQIDPTNKAGPAGGVGADLGDERPAAGNAQSHPVVTHAN